ncbi:MAG: DivIVA domain-containing protein [Propionibacteriaceae bacterium]|jgi:DivIVA domain-containing protein|nr:DivIVA domain-containing protein [Propionibacteriaceae bacterium]
MEWFIAIMAVVVLGLAAVAASGRLGQFGPAPGDRPEPLWPEDRMTSREVDRILFAVVPRGYAMDQVDEFCQRVRDRLTELESELDRSRLGNQGQQPGIMGSEQISDSNEVRTDDGSDETPDR